MAQMCVSVKTSKKETKTTSTTSTGEGEKEVGGGLERSCRSFFLLYGSPGMVRVRAGGGKRYPQPARAVDPHEWLTSSRVTT